MGSGSSLFKGDSKDLREEGTDQEGGATPPPQEAAVAWGPRWGSGTAQLGKGVTGTHVPGRAQKGATYGQTGLRETLGVAGGLCPCQTSVPTISAPFFIHLFIQNKFTVPCAKCGWRVRERGTQGVCSLAAGS